MANTLNKSRWKKESFQVSHHYTEKRKSGHQVEEKKDEHTEASETLQREKGKKVINDTSSSVDPSLEMTI
jgi:hypothetical protein